MAFEIDGSTECCGALAEVAEQLLFLGSRIGRVPDVIMWVESLTLASQPRKEFEAQSLFLADSTGPVGTTETRPGATSRSSA